jgi:hypothetical protein
VIILVLCFITYNFQLSEAHNQSPAELEPRRAKVMAGLFMKSSAADQEDYVKVPKTLFFKDGEAKSQHFPQGSSTAWTPHVKYMATDDIRLDSNHYPRLVPGTVQEQIDNYRRVLSENKRNNVPQPPWDLKHYTRNLVCIILSLI